MAGDQLDRRLFLRVRPALAVVAAALIIEPMPVGIALQGLIVGLVGALVAVGMALLYQSNRIVNFAQADMGLAPCVLGVSLAVYGGVSWFVAVPIGLAAAVLLGAVVELVVVRRFRRAPRLVLMVATIGLGQLFSATSVFIPGWWHKTPATLQLHVPWHLHFTVKPLVFSADHVLAVLVAPALLLAIAAALRFTNVGVAIRASADSTDRARLLGLPVDRLHTLVWAAAAVLSFTGLMLRTGMLGLGVGSALSLNALLAALTALVLGGFTDLVAVALSAVSLGLLEAGVVWNHPRSPGLVAPLYAVVLLACLLLRRTRRSADLRDHAKAWRLADDARPLRSLLRTRTPLRVARWAVAATTTIGVVALPHLLGAGSREKAAAVVVFSIVALSLVVLTGWTGQVSLGQMSFAALGAVAGAHATLVWHADMVVALVFAGAVGGVTAAVVGLPSLRLRGLFLAVTTLAFALTTSSYLFVDNRFSWVPTGRIPRPKLLGGDVLQSQVSYFYLCLAVAGLAVLALSGIRRSRTGRVLRAVREDSRVVQAYGVSVARAKLTAFAISGVLAAVAGCLLVHLLQSFSPATYAPEQSFVVFTAAVVGGLGSLLGGVLGAVFLKGGEWLLPSAQWQALTTAAGVLLVLWIVPGGLASAAYGFRDLVARLLVRAELRRPVIDLRDGADATAVTVSPAPQPSGNGRAPLLSCRDLRAAYGPTKVLTGVDFDVGAGEIIALLGTNGAGKSTLVKAICGLVPVTGGTVEFDGRSLRGMAAHEIARLGVALLPGGEGVFPSLTVRENLRVAGSFDRRSPAATMRAHTEQVLVWFPALRKRLDDDAGDLSGGQQQMLALGMAFLGAPRLLVLDELDLGLAPSVVAQLIPIVRGLRDRGTTIVIVEQSLNVAVQLAETAYFMEKGRMLFSGPTDGLLDRPDLLRAVFLADSSGGPAPVVTNGHRRGFDAGARPRALELTGLSVRFGGIKAVDDVSVHVDDGEIVGLIGPNGAGKSTLFDLVTGLLRPAAGRVAVAGRDVSYLPASTRARAGLGRTFQDAHLFPALTVAETIAVAQERFITVRDPVREALRLPAAFDAEEAVDARTDELIDVLNLGRYGDSLVRELSTGTKRIVEIACALAQRACVLLLDEPSTGLAQREAEALQPLLAVVREQLGAAIFIVEHDTALLAAVADRIVAMDLGRVIADGRPADVLRDPWVLSAYLGPAAELSGHGVRR